MKRRCILLSLFILLVFCVCACGNTENSREKEEQVEKEEKTSKADDDIVEQATEDMNIDTEVESEVESEVLPETETLEEKNRKIIVESEFHDYLFQIGEELYDFRDKDLLQKMLDNGFVIEGGMGYLSEWGSYVDMYNNEQGVSCRLYIESTSDEPQKYTEGRITYIKFNKPWYSTSDGMSSGSDKVFFFKGIHTGMTKAEVEELLGEPTTKKLDDYYDNSYMPQKHTLLVYTYMLYVGYTQGDNSDIKWYDYASFYFNGEDVLVAVTLRYDTGYPAFDKIHRDFGLDVTPVDEIEVISEDEVPYYRREDWDPFGF